MAQLGERSVRIREVEGSNPFGSISKTSFVHADKRGFALRKATVYDIICLMNLKLEVSLKMGKMKDFLIKGMAVIINVPITIAFFSLMALFAGGIMKMFGFTYESVGSVVIFFLISGILGYPLEVFAKAISNTLFSYFKITKEVEAWIILVVLKTAFAMIKLALVDYFMDGVSATLLAVFIISLLMSLDYKGPIIKRDEKNKVETYT